MLKLKILYSFSGYTLEFTKETEREKQTRGFHNSYLTFLGYDGNLLRREIFGCNETKMTLKERELSKVSVEGFILSWQGLFYTQWLTVTHTDTHTHTHKHKKTDTHTPVHCSFLN
jgi:hypothetical protein